MRADEIRDKVLAGERLDRKDGHWLLAEAPLLELGAAANEARFRRLPARQVTFVIDSNPNYTNVCITDCQFCAFYRKPGEAEAWTLTVDEVLAKSGKAVADYNAGNRKALEALFGAVMKQTKGKADPQVVRKLLTEKLA